MASQAAKRLSQSAVDWARLATVIPKAQVDALRIIKTKHDGFLNKVYQLPENLPQIDFAGYKARLPDPAMADRFKKAYEALSIPYPVDKDQVLHKVDVEKEEQDKQIKMFIAELQKENEASKLFLSKITSLPKFNEMTEEVFGYYFTETIPDPENPIYE